ncbi:N-succinylarginine dihydrolase [Algibacillus agarilyticus]|uniref:N-succinylarginine dihydrolase n=1 Tax=Algibacillus agarilyticus TaxID=2234133 RepID=UPI000DCF64FB|nr:N-succinylarginine dihydrolase [Algibacillus agarilyticus]
MKYVEVNFDGLVGPSHNYAGLSLGNIASKQNATAVSNPKLAALQGLDKMQLLLDLGLTQGVIPPHIRPNLAQLNALGFNGSVSQQLKKAYSIAPTILASCYSASNMWTANAATVTSSLDAKDNKIHFTPANLFSQFHRSIESDDTAALLQLIFNHEKYFVHHPHLPHHAYFADEGAANHTRLTEAYDQTGLNLFVYGCSAQNNQLAKPNKFPARQTLEACQAIARIHQLSDDNTVFIQQNPDVIDQGVFHNDVIAVGNLNVLFYHEQAFCNTKQVLDEINSKWAKLSTKKLHLIEVKNNDVTLNSAINSYLFNTQLIQLNNGDTAMLAPTECQSFTDVQYYLNQLQKKQTQIKQILYKNLNQSMQNGGGPACLRLRVNLSEAELSAVNPHFLLTHKKIDQLKALVNEYYPTHLNLQTLSSFETYQHIQQANQAISRYFGLNT